MNLKKLISREDGLSLDDVVPVAITLVVIAITLSVGSDVLEAVRDNQCSTGYTYNATAGHCHLVGNGSDVGGMGVKFNATTNGMKGINELSSFQDTWAVVLALAVIVGILGFLATR